MESTLMVCNGLRRTRKLPTTTADAWKTLGSMTSQLMLNTADLFIFEPELFRSKQSWIKLECFRLRNSSGQIYGT